jgi:hypothetical protein
MYATNTPTILDLTTGYQFDTEWTFEFWLRFQTYFSPIETASGKSVPVLSTQTTPLCSDNLASQMIYSRLIEVIDD